MEWEKRRAGGCVRCAAAARGVRSFCVFPPCLLVVIRIVFSFFPFGRFCLVPVCASAGSRWGVFFSCFLLPVSLVFLAFLGGEISLACASCRGDWVRIPSSEEVVVKLFVAMPAPLLLDAIYFLLFLLLLLALLLLPVPAAGEWLPGARDGDAVARRRGKRARERGAAVGCLPHSSSRGLGGACCGSGGGSRRDATHTLCYPTK